MPHIIINNAEIYYETFGKRTQHAPVVLIHGSTQTGRSCWDKVAPLLAEKFFVIVPDCRGHGRSTNPYRTYSFKEMADDHAALIRALGFERAHVIGHSNGGNVALVTLVEHPEVIQTCVVQAGNAWVSPDLVEKEPKIFDPDFIARERPDWMLEMIELHGPTHGADYWRDLVLLTVQAIITEPNYTPADLARVQRPALIVQGELDSVNAPQKHAQFIARHIPDAELWIPDGIGHNVHDEILKEWIATITDFIERRGNDASDALYRYKMAHYADERDGIFDARLSDARVLTGTVQTEAMKAEALRVLGAPPLEDHLRVLITDKTPWALINRPVENMHRYGRTLTELVSQLRLGEAVRVMDTQNGWSFVYSLHDHYTGWVRNNALHGCSASAVRRYQQGCTHIVSAMLAGAYPDPETSAALPPSVQQAASAGIHKIPFATLVQVIETHGGSAVVALPDGRKWWLDEADLLPLEQRPRPDAAGIAFTLNLMRQMAGVPYLWGGRTPYGYDCSGFAGTFYTFMGVDIPRDADQQFRAGMVVDGPLEPGDLVFFGDPVDEDSDRFERITHVGISLGSDEFIHANAADWGVAYNSFNPNSAIFRQSLKESYRGARRFR
ncbi:MAG: alpha/beta fold hydrolase [Anaerolineales bacterium]